MAERAWEHGYHALLHVLMCNGRFAGSRLLASPTNHMFCRIKISFCKSGPHYHTFSLGQKSCMHAYLTHKLYNNIASPLRVALSIICRCSGWPVRWSRLGLLGQTNSALHSSNNCQVRETLLSCLVPLSCSVIIHYYAILLQREAQTVEISTLLRLSCTSSLTTGGWDYFCSLPFTLTTMVRLLQQQAD